MPSPPAVRVIVRLPYNRPEDAPGDPPRIEWNADKEHILWEVIAKSRAIEGAGTDWKGLAQHLQVPLPYLLYRAQVRYEEDLRGLQGLNGPANLGLGLRTAVAAFPSAPSPSRANGPIPGEYFPRLTTTTNPDHARPPLTHRESGNANAPTGLSCSPTGKDGTTSTTGMSTLRPHVGVRARLSSLGHAHGRAVTQARMPNGAEHAHSPLSAHPGTAQFPRPTKKVSSSSTITLQGPKRTRSPALCPLSPASSGADSSSDGGHQGADSSDDDDDDSDEETRKEEEAEKQEALTRKLRDLERLMTKDALGLVADPPAARANGRAGGKPRGRVPPSGTSASLSSLGVGRDERNQSLSSASVDSPQGSIPSIPSPQAQSQQYAYTYQYPTASASTHSVHSHHRFHSQGHASVHQTAPRSTSQSQSLSSHSQSLSQSRSNSNPHSHSHSDPQSPTRMTSPVPIGRHLATPDKTSSPPALSPGSARGQTVHARAIHAGLVAGTPSESEASSFSDLSDASVSQSALESALMSNMSNMSNVRSAGSRMSSYGRSRLPSKRSSRG